MTVDNVLVVIHIFIVLSLIVLPNENKVSPRRAKEASSIRYGKVFYGQEPPSGESSTTECGVNHQLAVIY